MSFDEIGNLVEPTGRQHRSAGRSAAKPWMVKQRGASKNSGQTKKTRYRELMATRVTRYRRRGPASVTLRSAASWRRYAVAMAPAAVFVTSRCIVAANVADSH